MANGLCSDVIAGTIVSLDECRSAITKIPNFDGIVMFEGDENEDNYPKGCYLHQGDKGYVYWNNHQTGSPNSLARQVCIQTGL